MKRPLRRAVLLALACASSPLSAANPSPAAGTPVVAEIPPAAPLVLTVPATSGPLVPLAVPLPPELPPLPAPAEASKVDPIEPAPADGVPTAPPLPALTTGEETFARLRRQLKADNCDAGSNSARWRERYAGSPANFSRRLQTVLPLLDFVSIEVERAGLPAEFTFIPLVESWFQPAAIGAGGPAGMWQMIGSTARNHGIHIREGYDGRLSPVESTRAALSYLKVLQAMFGDWQAIVMAYNAGEGRMQHALRRAGSRVTSAADRRPHGLSNITYDYVAKLQALSCLVSQPHRFGLRLPVDTRFEPLVPMLLDPGVQSLDAFARASGRDPVELRRLNPGFRNGRVVAGVPRLVLAPPAAIAQARLDATTRTASADVQADLDPDSEREFAEMLEAALVDDVAGMSAITPEPVPPAAQATLAVSMVPAAAVPASEIAIEAAQSAPASIAASGFTDPPPSIHEVRQGESLWSIAKYYQLPIDQIRKANGLDPKATVHPGQVLRLVP